MIQRIAITGPESTGKTSLTQQLAKHYQTVWAPEFARDYLPMLNRPYTYNDILYIAQNQFRMNEDVPDRARRYFFCDTELIVTKIWCDVKFGRCHPWIENHISKQHFDLYLLTDIDLPWEPDPQREHPNLREFLMGLYRQELQNRNFPYKIIDKVEYQRISNAIAAVDCLQP